MIARRAKRDRRWMLIKCGFFIYMFIGVFALIWLRTTVVNLEYEISQMEGQKSELIKETKLVVAEKAKFFSIERIEKTAIERFGMKLPEREKVFFVKRTTGAAAYRASMRSVPGYAGYSQTAKKRGWNMEDE